VFVNIHIWLLSLFWVLLNLQSQFYEKLGLDLLKKDMTRADTIGSSRIWGGPLNICLQGLFLCKMYLCDVWDQDCLQWNDYTILLCNNKSNCWFRRSKSRQQKNNLNCQCRSDGWDARRSYKKNPIPWYLCIVAMYY
jgi:hypothetical protein